MIRLLQRRLIIPRGDTGSFSVPVLKQNDTDNIAVFTIFDELTHTRLFQKIIQCEGDVINVAFTHNDTVNLKPGKYLWDIKFYQNPQFVDGELTNGDEVDSYYAGFSLPVCEIRETADNYLVSSEAPSATLSSEQLDIITGIINDLNEALEEARDTADRAEIIADDITDLKAQLDNMPQLDWNQSNITADDYIKNKPTIRQQTDGGGILENSALSASGTDSHAEGITTTASGIASHAEGLESNASGGLSHAEGQGTIANHKAQHVFGDFNIADSSSANSNQRGEFVEIVGNGIDGSNRSNARTLDWNGNQEVAGDIIAYGCGGVNPISLANLKSQKLDAPNGTSATSIIINTENITTSVETDWDNPHGVALATARFPRGDVYFVEFNENTYKLNSQLIAVENKFKVVEFLGNISLYTSTAGFMGNVYDVPFCIISDLNDNGRIDVITETSGTYSIKITKDVVNDYGLDAQYIYNDAYRPLQYVPNESSTYPRISLGAANTVTAKGGIAIGTMNKVNGTNSFAIGMKNKTDHAYSICIGSSNISSGDTSYAEGLGTTASGDYSHSEGQLTESSGRVSHSEGYQNIASGQYSHVEGNVNVASGQSAHAEGTENKALADGSHAEGNGTTANSSAWYGHAEGYKTQVSGVAAHAEGRQSNASGNYSHAEGRATVASGNYSHAEGYGTTSSGGQSHAAGNSTIAAGNNQYVFGKFNVSDTNNEYIEIAGNGTADDARSNARTLDWQGNQEVAGDVIAHGCGNANPISLTDLKNQTDALRDYVHDISPVATVGPMQYAMIDDAAPLDAEDVTAWIIPYQNGKGDPSATNVREIVGRNYCNVFVRTIGHQIFPSTYQELQQNGVTLKCYPSGTFVFEGKATAAASFTVDIKPMTLNYGDRFIMGCKEHFALYDVMFQFRNSKSSILILAPKYTDYSGDSWTNSDNIDTIADKLRIVVSTGFGDFVCAPFFYTYTPSEQTRISWEDVVGTIYGGYVDVTNGVLVKTHKNIASYAGEELPGKWISSMDVYTEGATPTTGAQVVYELSEPVTYNIDANTIPLSRGNIAVSTNFGDVALKYRQDAGKLLENLMQPDESNLMATSNYAIDDFFMANGRLYRATVAIAAGERIVLGVNCIETTVAEQLTNIYNQLS